jgi:uncharacterized protein YcnI
MMRKKRIALGAATASVVTVAGLTPLASGHATVSLLQPQGKALTAARVAIVLRAPNEKAEQSTFQIVLNVPEPVQRSISIRTTTDWKVVLKRRDTGEKNAEGSPIMATEKVTWIAKTTDARIDPGFYGEWYFRMQNPTTPQKLCFVIEQWYSKKEANGKPELVSWSGPPESARPASCLDVVAS